MGKFLDPIKSVVQMAVLRYDVSGRDNREQIKKDVPDIVIMERSAILALTKYMCVSAEICKDNL